MKDFLNRLTSRKFLLAVAAGLTFYANGQYTELAATIIAYIAAEGSADALGRYSGVKTGGTGTPLVPSAAPKFDKTDVEDDVDRSTIVAGQ